MQTPLRPTKYNERHGSNRETNRYPSKSNDGRSANKLCAPSPDDERRLSQREKQISFGYATEGYRNMMRLIKHDPLLMSGGIIPLSPPDITDGNGEDDSVKTLENVVEQQRVQWVSSYYENKPKESRRILSSEQVRRARESSLVPNKLHVEECLLVILRDQSCFEPISSSVRESASSLLKCKEISPADAGLKVFVAPSPQNQVRLSAHSSPATYSHETPKRLNFVGTPTTENVCVNNCKLSTYEARCQSRPSEDSTAWLSPSFQPEERRQCSPNLLFRQSNAEPVFDMQQTPLNWNTVFMPPGYMASPSYGSRASRSVERMATPSTAPRRVTFLKGDKKTRRSDADTLMRNLFPNNLSPNNDDPSGNVVYSCTPMEGVCVREQKEREKEAKQIASNCAQQINFTE